MDELIIQVGADIGDADSELSTLKGKVDDVGDAADETSKKGKGLGGALDILGKGAMIAGGVVLALGAGLLAAAKSAAEEQVGIDRLNGTLKNAIPNWDGNTAAVEEYVNAGTKLAFQDDKIRDSLNLLVGQTHDLKEAQNLQAIAMDLARSKGIELEQATRLILKADDESFAALGKLGIQIDSNATKEEALAAIHLATAGAAGVYAESAAGAAERVQNALGDAFETIGHTVLDLVQGPLGGFADWLQSDAVQAGIQQLADLVGTVLTNAFKTVGDIINVVWPIIQPFAQAWVDFFTNLSSGMPVLDAIGQLFSDFGGAIGKAWEVIGPALGTLAGNIIQWALDTAPILWDKFINVWLPAFWNWVVEIWPPLMEGLGTLLSNIWNWIVANGPTILATLGQWAWAFISWIAPMIPPFLVELGKIAFNIIQWIGTVALPAILAELGKWATAFLSWIWDTVLPQLPGWLGQIAGVIWKWISDTAKTAGANAMEIGKKMAEGIGHAFEIAWKYVKLTVARLVADLLRWVAEQVNTIGSMIGAPGYPGGNGPSGKAIGGPVMAGVPYIVGERGPELFIPKWSGSIVPNNQLPSMSVPRTSGGNGYGSRGGGTLINNIYIDGVLKSTQQISIDLENNRIIEQQSSVRRGR